MRVIIQRVLQCAVEIDKEIYSKIGNGLLILLGIEDSDTEEDISWLVKKIINLRIFNDENNVMNKSILEITDSEIMVVSQFTLFASTKKGNRPSYIRASKPDVAIPIYDSFCLSLEHELGHKISCGKFGADMQISLVNDGPVTIIIDSKNRE